MILQMINVPFSNQKSEICDMYGSSQTNFSVLLFSPENILRDSNDFGPFHSLEV
jgi:hypothetical protein